MLWLAQILESTVATLVNRRIERRRTRTTRVAPRSEQALIGWSLPTVPDEAAPVYIDQTERSRHAYVLGATGSGKTNLILQLIDNDLRHRRTVVVIDLRGDLIDQVVETLAAKPVSDPVPLLIELRQEEFVVGFNPLLGAGEFHSRAFHVLNVLHRQADSWGVQLDETLRNALVALAEARVGLTEIEPLLTNVSLRRRTLSSCTDQTALSFFARFDALSRDRQAALVQPVLNKVTSMLAIPRVRRMIGSSRTIDFRQLLDTPGQITLISLAVDRLHQSAHLLGALLVSAIQHAAMSRVDLPESARNPVSLYIDEFETMASESFEAIIAEARRFALSLTLSHQNLGQIDNRLRQLLRGNVGSAVLFQTSAIDASELALDVVGLGNKEEVRQLLQKQAVGQAILNRRGQPSLHLQTHLRRTTSVSQERVSALRERMAAAWAQRSIEVDEELQSRLVEMLPKVLAHERKPRAARGKR